MRVYNDGVIATNLRVRDDFDSIWPRRRGERFVVFTLWDVGQCGILLAGKRAGRKVVSSHNTAIGITGGFVRHKNKFVPGTVGDPNAGIDTAFNGVGWKYSDDPNYVVYSSKDFDSRGIDLSGSNFPDWPIRSVNGGPAYIRNTLERSRYQPLFRSDEDLFCVYKDTETQADPEYMGRYANQETTSVPIGIEVRQMIHSWKSSPLNDVLIITYEIHNKSTEPLDSSYVGFQIWPFVMRSIAPVPVSRDSNVIVYFSDDPSRNLGYQYNPALREDSTTLNPYLGIGMLETPRNQTGEQNGMKFWTEDIYHNMYNRPRSHFTDVYRYDYIARDSIERVRHLFEGQGQPIHNSIFTGSGPFRMLPGDSITFAVALMVGNGLSNLLRIHDLVRRAYSNNLFLPQPPTDPTLSCTALDGAIHLVWDDAAERSTDPIVPDSLGRPFLGYRLYRARTIEGPYYKLKEWQIGRDSLVHEYLDRGTDGNDPTIPVGTTLLNNVSYFYKLTAYDEGASSLSLQSMESNGKIVEARPGARPRVAGDVSEIRIVPNPYLVSHQGQRSVDQPVIYFNYLPEECVIRIYTVGLDLVRVIEHNGGAAATWDLRTESGQQVASQLYIAHITTPEGKTAIRKFAVMIGE
ncbi:MAG: hypothetical protein KF749_09035 [Bacteroidetes bacterium]|nr:hypothetical protein [Bacteroidota bacterium]MCW5894768.1 hypothetical protein [Bacteroidota bacterium]